MLVQSWILSKNSSCFGGDRGRSQRGTKRTFVATPEFSRKLEISSSIPISSNESLLYGMTLHKSQVPCSGIMQWWTSSSLVSALCLQGQVRVARLTFLRPNFRNLALFQVGWPTNFVWLFSGLFLELPRIGTQEVARSYMKVGYPCSRLNPESHSLVDGWFLLTEFL